MNEKSTNSPDPSGFFEALYENFQRAGHSHEIIDRYFQIAGYTFCLRFAGPSLIPDITPALEHLALEHRPVTIDLTICLWDSVSSDAPLINKSWGAIGIKNSRRGELLDYCDDNFQAALQADEGILSILDKKRHLALGLIQHPALSVYKRASPCQLILHWWLREQGFYMVHAAAVGLDHGAAFLVGQSGTGKSTAALACLHAKMKYLADDRCVMVLNPEPRVYAMYNSGKVNASQLHLFPRFQNAISNPTELDTEKALLFVKQTAPEQIALHLPIKVILLTRLTHRPETTFSPVKPLAVCQILATSTMIYAPGWTHTDLQGAAQLVQKVPCYAINLGTDIWQIPKLISQVIENESNKAQTVMQSQFLSSDYLGAEKV